MKSRRARTIGAFRSSGLNVPGYSRPPQPAQAPPQPAQSAEAPVRRVAPENDITASYLVGRAQGSLVEPPISTRAHEHGVTIRIDGYQHRIPEGVEVAFGRSQDRDIVYLSRPVHSIVVLVAVAGVGVRELRGVPRDVLTDLRMKHFPEVGR